MLGVRYKSVNVKAVVSLNGLRSLDHYIPMHMLGCGVHITPDMAAEQLTLGFATVNPTPQT